MSGHPGQPKSSLDNLMLACADLSGPNRGGSSFKGPALKDVKVKRSEATGFKPSEKARDWSCLAQTLEDAFVSSDARQQNYQPQQQPALNPAFLQQQQQLQQQQSQAATWNHQLQQQQQVQQQPVQQQQVQQQQPSAFVDDWGDFQSASFVNQPQPQQQQQPYHPPAAAATTGAHVSNGFGAPLKSPPPPAAAAPVQAPAAFPAIQQPPVRAAAPAALSAAVTVPAAATDNDDEFADFVTASAPPPAVATTAAKTESPAQLPSKLPTIPAPAAAPQPPRLQQSPTGALFDSSGVGPGGNGSLFISNVPKKPAKAPEIPPALTISGFGSVTPQPPPVSAQRTLQPVAAAAPSASDRYSNLGGLFQEETSAEPSPAPPGQEIAKDEDDDFGDFIATSSSSAAAHQQPPSDPAAMPTEATPNLFSPPPPPQKSSSSTTNTKAVPKLDSARLGAQLTNYSSQFKEDKPPEPQVSSLDLLSSLSLDAPAVPSAALPPPTEVPSDWGSLSSPPPQLHSAATDSVSSSFFMPQPALAASAAASSVVPWMDDKPPPADLAEDDDLGDDNDDDLGGGVSTLTAIDDEEEIDLSVLKKVSQPKRKRSSEGVQRTEPDVLAPVTEEKVPEPAEEEEAAAERKSSDASGKSLHLSDTEKTDPYAPAAPPSIDPLYRLSSPPLQTSSAYAAFSSSSSSDSPFHEWKRVLDRIQMTFVSVAEALEAEAPKAAVQELLESERGAEYFGGLAEMRLALQRIGRAAAGCGRGDVEERLAAAERAWKGRLEPRLPQSAVAAAAPAADEEEDGDAVAGGCLCGVCLTRLDPAASSGVCTVAGASYHLPCANLWVNMVDPVLPSLTVTNCANQTSPN